MLQGQPDLAATGVQAVEIDNIELISVVVLGYEMVVCEDHMIVELFADDPDRKNRVLKMFSDLDILQGFKNRQETELGSSLDSSDLIVIDYLIPVETVRRGPTSQHKIHKFLRAMPVISYYRV